MWWLVVIVLLFLIPEILSTILDSRLGRALAAQIESRGREPRDDAVLERVRSLEGELDRLSQEVHRLSEETEFLQKLLSERSPGGESRLPPGDRPT